MFRIRETYINKKLISINVTDKSGISIMDVNIINCHVYVDDRRDGTSSEMEYTTDEKTESIGNRILDVFTIANETYDKRNDNYCVTLAKDIISEVH